VEQQIETHFPIEYATMKGNAKGFRFPKNSIFTGGTLSFMFAENTNQDIKVHKDKKDATGTVGVSINETVGRVEGGNLVILLPGGGSRIVPANCAVVAAFKELEHYVTPPTGGEGCRVSIILQQNEEVVQAAKREECGHYKVTAEGKKTLVVNGLILMNQSELEKYGTRENAATSWGLKLTHEFIHNSEDKDWMNRKRKRE
jgi:hypothetical protein